MPHYAANVAWLAMPLETVVLLPARILLYLPMLLLDILAGLSSFGEIEPDAPPSRCANRQSAAAFADEKPTLAALDALKEGMNFNSPRNWTKKRRIMGTLSRSKHATHHATMTFLASPTGSRGDCIAASAPWWR